MINFNNLKGFGGAPPQAPETLLGYEPIGLGAGGPNPDGGGGGFYPMPPPEYLLGYDPIGLGAWSTNTDGIGYSGRVNSYFEPIAINTRQQNINNMYSSADANGIIQNPYSSYDKTPFSEYVSQNAVTSEELQIARASVFGFYDYGPAVMPPIDRYSPPNPDGRLYEMGQLRVPPVILRPQPKLDPFTEDDYRRTYDLNLTPIFTEDDYRRTYDPLPSNDNNKLFFDCKQIDGVFVYTKESVSLYGTLQLQKKMQFYTDKGFLAKLKPAELGANISTPLGGKFVPFAKKMPNGRYKFIYSGENGTQTLIVSPKGVLVNIKSGGC